MALLLDCIDSLSGVPVIYRAGCNIAHIQPLYTSALEVVSSAKDSYLHQNYPNPFNQKTKISYCLPVSTVCELEIFDLCGRRVVTFLEGREEGGSHSVIWDATEAASGIYFYRLTAGAHSLTRKMMLVR